jgi:hypothetical protein
VAQGGARERRGVGPRLSVRNAEEGEREEAERVTWREGNAREEGGGTHADTARRYKTAPHYWRVHKQAHTAHCTLAAPRRE